VGGQQEVQLEDSHRHVKENLHKGARAADDQRQALADGAEAESHKIAVGLRKAETEAALRAAESGGKESAMLPAAFWPAVAAAAAAAPLAAWGAHSPGAGRPPRCLVLSRFL